MGCTSSAQNMTSTNHATEKVLEYSEDESGLSIKKDDDVISTSEVNDKKEIKVLPCDTLADPIQLDSNHKPIIDMSNLDKDEDVPNNNTAVVESENKAKENEDFQTGDKITSLEEVVEKVVELFVTDALANSSLDVSQQNANIDASIEKALEESDRISEKNDECESEPNEPKEELHEEALSPSQSTSSRATRWEALADIAAELPPSLTVDPLTGQIYALSK